MIARHRPNVVPLVVSKGQTVRLRLQRGGVLEISVDEVRGDRVGVVLAVTKPYFIEMDKRPRRRRG